MTILLLCAGCGGDESDAVVYELPGDAVFPEGIAIDKSTGDYFVGSTADGTVFRGSVADPGPAEVFLPPGGDGRETVTGLKVDPQGRLFVAGRDSGRVFVYEAASGDLLEAYELPDGDDSLVNDITFTDDAAYLTDSRRPVVYRIPRTEDGLGDLEPWLDLEGTPLSYDEGGFNLNGITASDDGRYVLAVHSDRGELWRIDVRTQELQQIDLGGDELTTGDGLLLDGTTLLVVRNDPGVVERVELADDLASGRVGDPIEDESFAYPTTIAELDGTLLVVNSQLGDEGGDPDLPFTVSGVEIDLG